MTGKQIMSYETALTMASDIARFLAARVAEDETDVQGDWASGDGGLHIISSPMAARFTAECKAKREIIDAAEAAWDLFVDWTDARATDAVDYSQSEGLAILRSMAAIYANHPDYREDWA